MPATDLTQRLLAGDDSAAAELYARYRPMVFDLLVRKLGNIEEAEGLTQEALMRALDVARTQEVRQFSSYALRVASNLAIDRLRRRRFEWSRADVDELQQDANQPDLAELTRLDAELAALPELFRAVLELKYHQGLSFSEIAVRLSMSKNGVFARHNRGLDMLREAFARRRT